jgi:hypothetical protein
VAREEMHTGFLVEKAENKRQLGRRSGNARIILK